MRGGERDGVLFGPGRYQPVKPGGAAAEGSVRAADNERLVVKVGGLGIAGRDPASSRVEDLRGAVIVVRQQRGGEPREFGGAVAVMEAM